MLRLRKILIIILFIIFLILFLSFVPGIQSLFYKRPKQEEIIKLQNDAKENNISAITELIFIYEKTDNKEMLQKYLKMYRIYEEKQRLQKINN